MKKFIALLLVAMMIVSMVACSNNNNTDPTHHPSTPTQPQEPTTTEPTITPSINNTEVVKPTSRPKPGFQILPINEYLSEKYGEYEYIRSEALFEMYRFNGALIFVYNRDSLKNSPNIECVYGDMFHYNWADNGYYQLYANSIEEYYDNLMEPYLKDIGEYALFAWLEQSAMPSGLDHKTPYADALKEYEEFLFPELFVLVENPLTEAQKTEITEKLTADGVKMHLHIGTATAAERNLSRNEVILDGATKYSNQINAKINWNGDFPSEPNAKGAQ